MSNKQSITIIGGGIIGLCSAYYLEKKGFQITIIDKNDFFTGCSIGNAGMIVPSHFIPMAQPGMIKKGLKWMFDSQSPFYIKPRLSGELIKWGWKFYQSANEQHVNNSMSTLKSLHLRSKLLYEKLEEELGNFQLQKKGLAMYCKSQKGLDEESEVAKAAEKLGIKTKILDPAAAQKLDPTLTLDIKGAVYYPEDAFLTPSLLIGKLIKHLQSRSVKMLSYTNVHSIHTQGNEISGICTSDGTLTSDQYLLATGSWTTKLSKKLGLNIIMQAGKGYSFTSTEPIQKPTICSILTEAKVAVTPMAHGLRFAGTMEIGGINETINNRRVEGIKNSISKYFPEFDKSSFSKSEIWTGLRPCSPDGLPYIGRTKKYNNLIVATGHGMMGLSMGPVTGEMVSKIAAEENVDTATNKVAVDRFDL